MAFDELAAFGSFFAVATHAPHDRPRAPWTALSASLDGDALADRIDAVRRVLASNTGRDVHDVDPRVAASVMHLGLVARLVAPAIAAQALGTPAPDLTAGHVWWQNRLGGPVPLSVQEAPPSTDRPAVTAGAVEAVTAACAERFGVSLRVLWGNVGSGVNTAATTIAGTRPRCREAAFAAADAVLADRRVDGGRLRSSATFRRRSCCLIYRVGGDRRAVCGDCVLSPEGR